MTVLRFDIAARPPSGQRLIVGERELDGSWSSDSENARHCFRHPFAWVHGPDALRTLPYETPEGILPALVDTQQERVFVDFVAEVLDAEDLATRWVPAWAVYFSLVVSNPSISARPARMRKALRMLVRAGDEVVRAMLTLAEMRGWRGHCHVDVFAHEVIKLCGDLDEPHE